MDKYVEQNQQHMEERFQSVVNRAQQRYPQKSRGDLPEKLQKAWKTQRQLHLNQVLRQCPACGSSGLLEAEEVQNERSDGHFDPGTGEHE